MRDPFEEFINSNPIFSDDPYDCEAELEETEGELAVMPEAARKALDDRIAFLRENIEDIAQLSDHPMLLNFLHSATAV